ncbi:MAG: hypothetical protein JWP58_1299, partial [Hymenobacter sp.]|nr:hypothetical protein [Hymenobacter sp.]
FTATHLMTDVEVLSHADFRAHVVDVFAAMVPFCQFLRAAIEA